MNTASSQDPLVCLPEELRLRVFRPFFKSNYLNLEKVSKRWKDYFHPPFQLWKDTCLKISIGTSPDKQLCISRWLEDGAPVFERLRIMLTPLGPGDPLHKKTAVCRSLSRGLQAANLKVLDFVDVGIFCSPGKLEIPGIWHMTSLESLTINILADVNNLDVLDSLSSLKSLRQLYIEVRLSSQAELPLALLELTQLEELALKVSSDQGTRFLTTGIDRLRQLQALELSPFWIESLELSVLTKLTYLRLDTRDPQQQTEHLFFPTELRQLGLDCDLIPPSLAECTAMTRLELGNFDASDESTLELLEEVLRSLPLLDKLGLNCSLRKLPTSLTTLQKLRVLVLHLDQHKGEGFLPEGSWIARLQVLELGWLTNIPGSLAGAANLEILEAALVDHLDLAQAKLVASLPKLKEVFLPCKDEYEDERIAPDAAALLASQAQRLKIQHGTAEDCRSCNSDLAWMSLGNLGIKALAQPAWEKPHRTTKGRERITQPAVCS